MPKLYAFDIDGTLISMSGAGGRAFRRGLLKTYGTVGDVDNYSFAGKTDPQIVRELMAPAGIPQSLIEEKIDSFFECYKNFIKEEVITHPKPECLPGIRELLNALSADSNVYLILVTGNIKEGGYIKLKALGLDHYFPTGSFGSDSMIRNELPEIAFRRSVKAFGITFKKEDMIVIGDTPADIECANAFGVKSVAVATGFHSEKELNAYSPDLILPSFQNWKECQTKMAALF